MRMGRMRRLWWIWRVHFDYKLNCNVNHHESGGSMGADGLIEYFQVSEKDREPRYINYLGGDSKSFLEISELYISTKTSKKTRMRWSN